MNKGRFTEKLYAACQAVRNIRDISVNAKHFPPEDAPILETRPIEKPIRISEISIPIKDMLGPIARYGAGLQVCAKGVDAADRNVFLLVNEVFAYWKGCLNCENYVRSKGSLGCFCLMK